MHVTLYKVTESGP